MLQFVIFSLWLLQASTSMITEYGGPTGEYGNSTQYECSILDPTGVMQVTWERRFKDGVTEKLVTYSKRFGKELNERYWDRLTLTNDSYQTTSITLRNLTWEDESCFICSFHVYPHGIQRKEMCLNVKGISHVETDVQHLNSEPGEEQHEEVVFSCTAAGKPAPTIEWIYPSDTLPTDQPQTTTVNNSDHTFTSSRNITLRIPVAWSGHVDCLLNSGATGERWEKIPFHLSRKSEAVAEGGKGLSPLGVFAIVGFIISVSCCTVFAVLKRKRLKNIIREEFI